MTKSFLLLFLVAISFYGFSQKRNTAYLEVLGNGLILSANYEQKLKKIPSLAWHAGVGLGGDKPSIPFGVKYLFNIKGQKSFIETGCGITLLEREMWTGGRLNYNPATDKNNYVPGFIPSVGFRYHASSGFMGRINYTPVFNRFEGLAFFFGISMGWRF